jgi:hypothetical protein
MDEKPKTRRRWFRFRLSTVLILTAISAWGMATRPYVSFYDTYESEMDFVGDFTFCKAHKWNAEVWTVTRYRLNSRLALPALALAAFLAWKAAWAMIERRRGQSAAKE